VSNLAQRSFTSGELAPSLYARTDLARYTSGLRTCRNWIVNRYGGVSNRPGTVYLGATKNNGAVKLIRFEFSADQTYVMEFGDRYLRWYSEGGRVEVSSATAWANAAVYAVAALVSQSGVTYYCTVAHTAATATNKPGSGSSWASVWSPLTMDGASGIYEIPTPYLAADLARLQTMQVADVVTIVHPSYAPRELKRFAHTKWTLSTIAFGPSIVAPSNVAATGGTAGASTYYAVTATSSANGDEGMPGTYKLTSFVTDATHPVAVTWNPVSGALTYSIYKSTDGQTFGFVGNAGGVLTLHTLTSWTTSTSAVTTSSLGAFVSAVDQARQPTITSGNDRPADGTFTIAGRITVSTGDISSNATGQIRAYYSRDSETRVDAGVVATAYLTGAGTMTQSFSGSIVVPDNGYTTLTIDLVAEVEGETGATTYTCSLSESSAPDNSISWRTTGTGFTDSNITPDYKIGPPTNPSVFAAVDQYPSAVSSFQQRRFFGNTNSAPELLRGSRTAIPASFTTSTPQQDDDALSFQLASRELNEVRHIADLGRLLVFASSGEWIAEGDNSNILKPSAINARRFSAHGSAYLPPIIIGTSAIYVQARNTVVRDLRVDSVQGISSNELSVFAAHLFDGYTIVDWDFAQIPHNIAWVVRSDGVMLGLTYLPEQDVWGWHRHDTDGTIEGVCVVPEGSEDAVYLVVNRTINGSTVRYVERMSSRAITALTDVRDLIFMDAALTYDGRNTGATTMTLSGGSAWDNTETITITRSVSGFASSNVGDAVVFYDSAGAELFRVDITAYSSGTVVTGRPNKSVPAAFRSAAVTAWGLAVHSVSGLSHLNGEAVSIVGDGYVLASPNNSEYGTAVTVSAGVVALSRPSVVVHVGLPYLSDLETLDIDTASGPSLKPFKMLVDKVSLVVEKSRAFYVGQRLPSGSDPLQDLDIVKFRDIDDEYDITALKTGDYECTIQGRYSKDGRVFVRQADPVPTSILAVIPQGMIPPTN
jgi:hypothetical protein